MLTGTVGLWGRLDHIHRFVVGIDALAFIAHASLLTALLADLDEYIAYPGPGVPLHEAIHRCGLQDADLIRLSNVNHVCGDECLAAYE